MNNQVTQIGLVFPGAAGSQFGRDVFITMVPFNSVERFFLVFPEVQRSLNKKRSKDIAQYIIKGLSQRNYSFLSAITATCRGDISYDNNTKMVTIDLNAVLSVNDGQHRVEGIKIALEELRTQVKKTRIAEEKQVLQEKVKRLENMTIPVVIFTGMDEQSEQQLFHDLNQLATRPTKSVSLKFDNTDLYNLLAKDIKEENPFLFELGIETEKTQLRDNNSNLMVLSTLRNMISYIISGSDKDKELLTLDNYDDWKEKVNAILNRLFSALPEHCNDRSEYIIGLAVTLQGVGKYINIISREKDEYDFAAYIDGLSDIDWNHNAEIWEGNGGYYDDVKRRFIFSGTIGGINGVCKALLENNKPKY